MLTVGATVKIFSSVKKMKSRAIDGNWRNNFFSHKSGAMQFVTMSSWARRFFKSVTMATQAGS